MGEGGSAFSPSGSSSCSTDAIGVGGELRSDVGDVRGLRVGESTLWVDTSTAELEGSVGEEIMVSTVRWLAVAVYSPGAPARGRSPQAVVGRPHRCLCSF